MKNQTKKNTIDVQLNLRLRFGHKFKTMQLFGRDLPQFRVQICGECTQQQ